MLVTILIVAGALVMLGGVVLAGWWTRKIEDELDHPRGAEHRFPRGQGDPSDRCRAEQWEQHAIALIRAVECSLAIL
jgi:hypothetical protein